MSNLIDTSKICIIVLGCSGMLGKYVSEYFKRNNYIVECISRENLNVKTDILNLYYVLSTHTQKYGSNVKKYFINCVGCIPQKNYCASDVISVNAEFPHKLNHIIEILGGRLIHITTDCVFSGKTGNYNELCESDASNVYGMSKYMGECKHATVIRTSIIGEELYNKKSLLEWIKSFKTQPHKSIPGFTNHYWNGITCLTLAKYIEFLIINDLLWIGTRHVFSESVTKYELIKMVCSVYKISNSIIPTEDEPINRTLSSIHSSLYSIPPLLQQLHELYEFHLG